jgi:hypothetical protein
MFKTQAVFICAQEDQKPINFDMPFPLSAACQFAVKISVKLVTGGI